MLHLCVGGGSNKNHVNKALRQQESIVAVVAIAMEAPALMIVC